MLNIFENCKPPCEYQNLSATFKRLFQVKLLPPPVYSDTLCNSGGDGTAVSDALQSRQSCASTSRNQFKVSHVRRRGETPDVASLSCSLSLSSSRFYFYFLSIRRVATCSPSCLLPPLFPTSASPPSSLQPSPVASRLSSHLVAMVTSSSHQSTLSRMNILVQLSGFLPHHDLSFISAGRHSDPLLFSFPLLNSHPFFSTLPFSSPLPLSSLPSIPFFLIQSLPSLDSLLFFSHPSFSRSLRHSRPRSSHPAVIDLPPAPCHPYHTFTHYYYYFYYSSYHLLSLSFLLHFIP